MAGSRTYGGPAYHDSHQPVTDRFMKFSVTPESKRAVASALFATESMKKWTVIDFRANINTSSLLLCLISAKVIRQQENPDYLRPSWLFLGQFFLPWTYC